MTPTGDVQSDVRIEAKPTATNDAARRENRETFLTHFV